MGDGWNVSRANALAKDSPESLSDDFQRPPSGGTVKEGFKFPAI